MTGVNTANRDRYPFAAPTVAPADGNLAFFVDVDAFFASCEWQNLGGDSDAFGDRPGYAMTAKIQDSANGTVWADVAGTEFTLVPRGVKNFSATFRKYIRVVASSPAGTQGMLVISPSRDLNITHLDKPNYV